MLYCKVDYFAPTDPLVIKNSFVHIYKICKTDCKFNMTIEAIKLYQNSQNKSCNV